MCVLHGMSALGHDIFSWSDFHCKQRTPEGSLSQNPELSLFRVLHIVFFFPIKSLTWVIKVRFSVFAIFQFSVCFCYIVYYLKNFNLLRQSLLRSICYFL